MRHKIFLTFSVLVLFSLLSVGVAVHKIFTSAKSEEVITQTEKSITQLNQNLDLMLEDAARTTLTILYNDQLLNILRQYDDNTPVQYRNYNHVNAFSLFLSGAIYNREQMYGMHVFANNGQVFSHMDDYRIMESIYLPGQAWYSKVQEKKGDWIVYPGEIPSYYRNNRDKTYISLIRLLRDPDNQRQLGFMKVDFSPEYVQKITEQLHSDHWQIYRDGEPLFKKDKDYLLMNCEANGTWVKSEQSESEYLCVTNTSNKTGIEIRNVIPKDYLYSEIKEFNNLLITMIIFCLFISLMLSYYMSSYLLKPLERLKKRIEEFQRGNHSNQIDVTTTGDIGELGGAYNNMLGEINSLVEEMYELNVRNSEAEYKALQSKMDPHFLFNALESINMTALKNGQLQLSDMISELGKLIRYRLRNDEKQITLKEEIDFTKTYVNIMKHRLGDAINDVWDIEGELIQYYVPKYILQPLIENAITHGLTNSIEKIHITVRVKRQNEYLHISVEDNGAGIPLKKQNELAASIEQRTNPSTQKRSNQNGIALENIASRLKLIYGSESEFHIHSASGKGTRIHISIPIKGR
nr:sensor histidine kinase [Salirhabdus salicampi]